MSLDVRVLIVEDDEAVRELLCHQLAMHFNLIGAGSSEEALRVLDREDQIRVVVADLQLPGRDGIELLRSVREHRPGTIRILMTANLHFDAAADAVNLAGVHRFLEKPCLAGAVRNAIWSAIDQLRAESGAWLWTNMVDESVAKPRR